jgi:hypothetical protein
VVIQQDAALTAIDLHALQIVGSVLGNSFLIDGLPLLGTLDLTGITRRSRRGPSRCCRPASRSRRRSPGSPA